MNHIANRYKYPLFEDVAHLCYYIAGNRDLLSQKIIEFKDGNKDVAMKWAKWASDEMLSAGWEDMDFILRSLGSTETEIPIEEAQVLKPLDNLAAEIVDKTFLGYYPPYVLKKEKPTRKLAGITTRDERVAELDGVYKLDMSKFPEDLNDKKVLIIDDVTTSGTTLNAIARAIKNVFPKARLYGFCLAQTQRDGTNDGIKHPF